MLVRARSPVCKEFARSRLGWTPEPALACDRPTAALPRTMRFRNASKTSVPALHCLVLDGVYRRTDGEPTFVEVPAPTNEALQALLLKIAGRLMKLLSRRGCRRVAARRHRARLRTHQTGSHQLGPAAQARIRERPRALPERRRRAHDHRGDPRIGGDRADPHTPGLAGPGATAGTSAPDVAQRAAVDPENPASGHQAGRIRTGSALDSGRQPREDAV